MRGTAHGRMLLMIGGEMVVEGGNSVDTRQPLEDDEWGEVMTRSLANSWLWWSCTSSLVLPILESAGAGAFALVIGQKSVLDLKGDGSTRRTGLKYLLSGGVGSVSLVRTGMNDRSWPEDSVELEKLEAWNGQSMGSIGFKLHGDSMCRWRTLDGNPYYLRQTLAHLAPTVIIDTTGTPAWHGVLTTADEQFGPNRPSHTVQHFATLERERLTASTILVAPHTQRAEIAAEDFILWTSTGRPQPPPPLDPTASSYDPMAPLDRTKFTRIVPIEADFGVTRWMQPMPNQEGKSFIAYQWRDSSEIEAARSLLARRFDLKIGIWDLVTNSTLRTTLLDSTPLQEVPKQTSRLPQSARNRAESIAASKEAARWDGDEVLLELRARAKGLIDAGWQSLRPQFNWLELPMTDRMHGWPYPYPGQEKLPLVSLSLRINKRSTVVNLYSSICDTSKVKEHVESKASQLRSVTQSGTVDLDALVPVLWQVPGGWADTINWESRFAELVQYSEVWRGILHDLVAESMRIRESRFQESSSDDQFVAGRNHFDQTH